MTEKTTKRSFSVAPAIIMNLIKSQSGTLGKAVLEAVCNSIDAGANKVDISIDAKGYVIQDDGRGFQTREEIEQFFEVFGFEHQGLDRVYGAFGIGRGQLWSWSSTVWKTNTFEMKVNVRKAGLDYDLVEGVSNSPGLCIVGTFYEPLRTLELIAFERELKELAVYAQIPVALNGEIISKRPHDEKWTHETPQAWLRISPSANCMSVFNLGVKVRDFPAYQFGIGGVVITKPGVQLKLNMARNDVLVSECPVWKNIRPFLQRKSDEQVKRNPKLSEEQLSNIAMRAVAGELSYEDVAWRKLVSNVLGQKWTIEQFLRKVLDSDDKTVTYCDSGEISPVAEASQRNNHCVVLSAVTLKRFGASTMNELIAKLFNMVDADNAKGHLPWRLLRIKSDIKVVEDWRDACKKMHDGYTEIARGDWTKFETACIVALESANDLMPGIVAAPDGGVETNVRVLHIGLSEVAEAWTDGKGYVCLNRNILPRMKDGLAGAMSIVNILLHEYLHQDESAGSHIHDAEFYERFESVSCNYSNQWLSVGNAAKLALKKFATEAARTGVRGSTGAATANNYDEKILLAA